MPLNEQVLLDIQTALRQIDQLESRLQVLAQPIDIPVQVDVPDVGARVERDLQQAESAVDDLNRELRTTERELDTVGDEADRTGRDLETAGRRGASAFQGLGGALTAVGAGVLAARGLREVAGFLGDSVKEASNLEQAIGGVESVFGEASAAIFDFGQTTAQSVGLARSEAFQLSSLIGSQLQTFGFGAAEAAAETQNLISLSADLAATFGGPVSDAVAAVSSLLRGETNPIERYAVAMNQTLIQAHALEIGLIDTNRQLTLQERAVAALDLLYQQTTNSQGQFARESGTTAGLMERLSAAFQDAQAEIGEALVPAFNSLLQSLPGIVEGIGALAPAFAALGQVAGPVALDFAALFGAISDGERDLRKWSTQSGIATDSADLLAGAIVKSADEIERADRDLGFAGDGAEEFTTRLRELLDAAETSPTELRRLFRDIGNLDEFLNPRQIAIVRDELLRLLVATDQFSNFSEGSRFASQLATDLHLLGPAAVDAATGVTQSIEEMEAALGRRSLNLEPITAEIEGTFDALAASMDAVKNSLRDDENEIVDDFAAFFDNLERELQTQLDFARNIDILRAMGLDDLADQLEPLGPEFGGLVADAIANPETARDAERALDQFAEDMGRFAHDALLRELLEQVTDPFKIPINIEGILNSVNIPGIGRGLIENIQIPGGAGGGVPLPPGGGGGGNNLPVGGTNITNNFYSQPQPTTDTERIKQALRTIT